jgi:catechol 2,3-dioxygenase-like lactoylglutathione lyase family enzyme
MIGGVHRIVVPVDDQDRAKEFWVDRLGFRVVQDESRDGTRALEVTPPDRSTLLMLSARPPGERRLPPNDEPSVFFTCDDIDTTQRELTARGVRFHTPPAETSFGQWSMFEDPDGTRSALAQYRVAVDQSDESALPVERFTTLFRASLAAELGCVS